MTSKWVVNGLVYGIGLNYPIAMVLDLITR